MTSYAVKVSRSAKDANYVMGHVVESQETRYSWEVGKVLKPLVQQYLYLSSMKAVGTHQTITPDERFRLLSHEWARDTAFLSSISEMTSHHAYRHIISMGKSAIPLILKELEETQNMWFPALKEISGDDPVPAQYRGNIPKMTEYWVAWGKQNGFI